MEVVRFKTEEGSFRYYLADGEGIPIESVLKFIRFKDNAGYAKNTLRMYCYHLKHYFEFLDQKGVDFQSITIDDLSLFVNWLQNPYKSLKIVPKDRMETARVPETINVIVNTVLLFYDYALRHEKYSNNICERLKKVIAVPGRNFKGFLYGIAEEKKRNTHLLKLRIKKRSIKTLSKGDIQELLSFCINERDRFLLSLLYETGMRIGEALSLWIEDVDVSRLVIDLKDRGTLENQAEIKTVSSPRRIDISQNIADAFMGYLCNYQTEEVLTNHIFIKLSGSRRYKAMDYTDVNNVFRKLKKKTKIAVTPHMFRHSSLTVLRMAGWEPELLRIRAGHKNIYTTLNTYIHPSEQEVSEAFHASVKAHGLGMANQDGDADE